MGLPLAFLTVSHWATGREWTLNAVDTVPPPCTTVWELLCRVHCNGTSAVCCNQQQLQQREAECLPTLTCFMRIYSV